MRPCQLLTDSFAVVTLRWHDLDTGYQISLIGDSSNVGLIEKIQENQDVLYVGLNFGNLLYIIWELGAPLTTPPPSDIRYVPIV